MTSLKKCRAIIDTNDNKVYFLGPGEYNLMEILPPGTVAIQGEIAPSGHLVLPCCDFEHVQDQRTPVQDINLLSQQSQKKVTRPKQQARSSRG